MRLLLLRLGLVLALGLSAAAEVIVGSWTMSGLFKACEGIIPVNHTGPLCTLQFLIGESAEPTLPMTWCTVSAHGLDATGKNLTFSDAACREGGAAQTYRVSSAWHRAGFVTMCHKGTMSAWRGYLLLKLIIFSWPREMLKESESLEGSHREGDHYLDRGGPCRALPLRTL